MMTDKETLQGLIKKLENDGYVVRFHTRRYIKVAENDNEIAYKQMYIPFNGNQKGVCKGIIFAIIHDGLTSKRVMYDRTYFSSCEPHWNTPYGRLKALRRATRNLYRKWMGKSPISPSDTLDFSEHPDLLGIDFLEDD